MSSTQLATDFTVKRLDEMEAAFGGSFVRARASLGASAFGMQVHLLPPNSGDAYPEHDHLYDGEEEVYLLLSGTADLHLPGRVVSLDPDTFVRVGPSTRRRIRTGPQGARILVIGGIPGAAYEPAEISLLGGPETPTLPHRLKLAGARLTGAPAAVTQLRRSSSSKVPLPPTRALMLRDVPAYPRADQIRPGIRRALRRQLHGRGPREHQGRAGPAGT